MDQMEIVLRSLQSFWHQLSTILPKLFGAVVLIILGWVLAKALRKGAIRLMRLIKLDVAAEKSRIDDFLLQGGVKYTAVTLIGSLIYWFVLFTVLLAVLNSIGLPAAEELFNKIMLFIPNVMVAILVLMFGALFAQFVRGIAFTYLSNIGISGAAMMSVVAQWAILAFVLSIALEQLSIHGQILTSAFQIAFGALCLALALAFGLGGREWAARIMDKMSKQTD